MPQEHEGSISISSTIENVMTNEDEDMGIFGTPLGDETDPLTPKVQNLIDDENDRKKQENVHRDTYLDVAGAKRALRRWASDLTLRTTQRCKSSGDSLMPIRVDAAQENHSHVTSPDRSAVSLPTPCHNLRRMSSSSRLELLFRHHNPSIDSASLQKQLSNQIKRNGQVPPRTWRVLRARASSGSFKQTNTHSARPGFKWFPLRLISDSAPLSQTSKGSVKEARKMPLKSSMKTESRSATTSPPSTATTLPITLVDSPTLRRVKTVDFEEAIVRKLAFQSLKLWSNDSSHDVTPEEMEPTTYTKKKSKVSSVQDIPAALRSSYIIKSEAAHPVVTKTDVHVVAIAPCWSSQDTVQGGIDSATPTMQKVESKSGCFEIIWDDVPVECNIRVNRPSSSASHALHKASRGLDRVNTKLTEWNIYNGEYREPFKPQVVVFPDDDGRLGRTYFAVEDEDDKGGAELVAPPNSEKTSAAQSRFASRPNSMGPSCPASHDGLTIQVPTMPEAIVSLVVPNTDAPTDTPPSIDQSMKQLPTLRRLSNVEESEMKFRGHRDSITLEHSRILRSRGVSPELFMRSDSVYLAKKRMHARNHAISESQRIPRRFSTKSDPLMEIEGKTVSLDMPSPPTVKEHATNALKSSVSASILRSQPAGSKRHIQIVG